jgi:uncharacterized protein (TIGR03000 family)
MFRNAFLTVGVGTLAVAGLFLLPAGTAPAQERWNQQGWPVVNAGGGVSSPASAYAPVIASQVLNPQQPPGYYGNLDTETYYGSSLPSTRSASNRDVEIAVTVPSSAKIWFDDAATVQTGSFRRFASPPLTAGHDYVYQVRASWREGNRTLERTKNITVHAGDRINLDFTGGRSAQTYQYGAFSPNDEQYGPSYPLVPRRWGLNPNVAPASEQDPMNGFGPPGSNDPRSLGVGQG